MIITARRAAGLVVLVSALAPIAVARAQRSADDSRLLWATVNVCDTERWPDTIGIRGSMPGSADDRETLWMRFRVQFLSTDDNKWHSVPQGGDSGFISVGSARARSRQSGRSFRISPHKGEPVLLRGVVSFQWRLKDVVTRSESMRTLKGHRSSAGADPPSYTASTCTITPDS
jgi:hypothetical protein